MPRYYFDLGDDHRDEEGSEYPNADAALKDGQTAIVELMAHAVARGRDASRNAADGDLIVRDDEGTIVGAISFDEAQRRMSNTSAREAGRGALRMIRETLETLGPPGALPSEAAVTAKYGPELSDEAQAICDALQRVLGREGA